LLFRVDMAMLAPIAMAATITTITKTTIPSCFRRVAEPRLHQAGVLRGAVMVAAATPSSRSSLFPAAPVPAPAPAPAPAPTPRPHHRLALRGPTHISLSESSTPVSVRPAVPRPTMPRPAPWDPAWDHSLCLTSGDLLCASSRSGVTLGLWMCFSE
jgi:hypothetical protein